MSLQALAAVFEFEFRRTLSWRRSLFVLALALFPVLLLGLMQLEGASLRGRGMGERMAFILVPEVICVMGLLLWATPCIYSELEEKTWAYIAVRPVGRGTILMGKYLAAVAWTLVTATLSLALCLGIVSGSVDLAPAASGLGALVLISALAYGAVYVLLGVLFPQRAMVTAVAYTALMEGVIAWVPATTINRFSVLHHLRCLLIKWATVPRGFEETYKSTNPAWQHLLILAGLTAAALAVAVFVLRRRQLVIAVEA
ncbi:MAG: ABC transporter permease [Planctomycetota bacterium]|jgi:ABC-type transport system involved in multi-copper enzyme maturation permease subunit